MFATQQDFEQEIQFILRENNELKMKLLNYREDLYTLSMIKTEKRTVQIERTRNCKIFPCSQVMNKLNYKLKECEKRLKEYSERLYVSQKLLMKKSEEMAILEADYQIIKNENLIMKQENKTYEIRWKDSLPALQYKVKDLQNKLYTTEDNYHRVCLDHEKSQKQLIEAATREIELQCSLSEALENSADDQTINKLKDLTNNLNLELENTQRELNEKECAFLHAIDNCKVHVEQINFITRQVELLKERNTELSEKNEYLLQQIQGLKKFSYVLKHYINKDKIKVKSKKTSKQIRMICRKKMHDGELSYNVSKRTIGRCKRHADQSARPYTSDITISTCCSISPITMAIRASMSGNSL